MSEEDKGVIARCVERQPKIYVRGQHEGYYIHSDIADLIRMAGDSRPAPDKLALAVEALERIADLGSDGEHSGDRHARCRDFARSALAALKAST